MSLLEAPTSAATRSGIAQCTQESRRASCYAWLYYPRIFLLISECPVVMGQNFQKSDTLQDHTWNDSEQWWGVGVGWEGQRYGNNRGKSAHKGVSVLRGRTGMYLSRPRLWSSAHNVVNSQHGGARKRPCRLLTRPLWTWWMWRNPTLPRGVRWHCQDKECKQFGPGKELPFFLFWRFLPKSYSIQSSSL